MATEHPPAHTRNPGFPLPRFATSHNLPRTLPGTAPFLGGHQRSQSHDHKPSQPSKDQHPSRHSHDHAHPPGKLGRFVGRLRSSSDLSRAAGAQASSTSPPKRTHSLRGVSFKRRHSPRAGSRSSSSRPDAQASLDLWIAAYDSLRDYPTSAGLVVAFEAVISQELPQHLRLGGMATTLRDHPAVHRCELLSTITSAGLEKRRPAPADSQETTSEGLGMARRIVESTKDTVEVMLKAYPSAGVACCGLCTLTPLHLEPLLERDSLREGLLHVAGRVTWYLYLSQLLLRDSWEDPNTFAAREQQTRDALQRLYRRVLEFQMNSVCAAASVWNNLAKNVVDWQGLGRLLVAIKDAEDEVRASVEKGATQAVKTWLRRCDRDLDLDGDGDGDGSGGSWTCTSGSESGRER